MNGKEQVHYLYIWQSGTPIEWSRISAQISKSLSNHNKINNIVTF